MPDNRPPIPAELERQVKMEAGFRCAIPACQQRPIEIAHIVPWSKVQKHEFENLIALCANCHSLHHQGVIDRKAMHGYKARLAERNRVHLKPVDPEPDPVEIAWERLREWEDESRLRFCARVRDELSPNESPMRYAFGLCTATYALVGEIESLPLEEWRNLLEAVQADGTGIPPWRVEYEPQNHPRPVVGPPDSLEAWLGQDIPSDGWNSEFWRVSPDGLLYQISGFDEDQVNAALASHASASVQNKAPQPDTLVMYWDTRLYRVAQVLLHARRLAKALALPSCQVVCQFRWDGLERRKLVSGSPLTVNMFDKEALQPEVMSEIQTDLTELREALPNVVHRATERLFSAFQWATIDLVVVRKVIDELQRYAEEHGSR